MVFAKNRRQNKTMAKYILNVSGPTRFEFIDEILHIVSIVSRTQKMFVIDMSSFYVTFDSDVDFDELSTYFQSEFNQKFCVILLSKQDTNMFKFFDDGTVDNVENKEVPDYESFWIPFERVFSNSSQPNIDSLLDKILANGVESLTNREKTFLTNYNQTNERNTI